MRARIRRWGNSLALRIPKAFAEEAFLRDESVVDLKVVNGKLVVASVVELARVGHGMTSGKASS